MRTLTPSTFARGLFLLSSQVASSVLAPSAISGHSATDRSFSVSEFVALEDGRRVILHEDRGFTIGWRSDQTDPGDLAGQRWTLESLTRDVLNVVLPDDDECAEEHPWSWLAELARARGLNVTAEDLRCLPYEVTFTDSVRRWLASA